MRVQRSEARVPGERGPSLRYLHGAVAVVRFRGADAGRRRILVVVQAQHQHVVLPLASVNADGWADRFPLLLRQLLTGKGLLVVMLLLLLLLLLLLHQTVDLEPVRSAPVPRARLGHAHQKAFPQTARLAGCSILLVDHALPAILALGDAAQVVVGPSEERLEQTERSFRYH